VANVALAAGCIPPENMGTHSTPAPLPAAIMPDVAVAEPPPGTTSVVLDAVDGAADVTLVRAHTQAPLPGTIADGRVLCATPCAVSLPPGRYELRFSRAKESTSDRIVNLNVHEEPILYRRALDRGSGENEPVMITGLVTYTIGGWAFWISLIKTAADDNRSDKDWAFVASSAAVSLLGLLVLNLGMGDLHPGSDAIFTLPL